MGRRGLALAGALGALLMTGAGCGDEEGVDVGAVVTAYVSGPLCAGAEDELSRAGGKAGEMRVRSVCLAGADRAGVDLAAVGANARRASEDSTTIAYLEPAGPANRFSRPILESAGIAHVSSGSGERAMARVLRVLRGAGDAASPREAVAEALGGD